MGKKRRKSRMQTLVAELDQQFKAWGNGEKLKDQKLGNDQPKQERQVKLICVNCGVTLAGGDYTLVNGNNHVCKACYAQAMKEVLVERKERMLDGGFVQYQRDDVQFNNLVIQLVDAVNQQMQEDGIKTPTLTYGKPTLAYVKYIASLNEKIVSSIDKNDIIHVAYERLAGQEQAYPGQDGAPYKIKVDNVHAVNPVQFDMKNAGQFPEGSLAKHLEATNELSQRKFERPRSKPKNRANTKKYVATHEKPWLKPHGMTKHQKNQYIITILIVTAIVPVAYYGYNTVTFGGFPAVPEAGFHIDGLEIIDGNMDNDISSLVDNVTVYGSYSSQPLDLHLIEVVLNPMNKTGFGSDVAEVINTRSGEYEHIYVRIGFEPGCGYADRTFEIEENANNRLHCFTI